MPEETSEDARLTAEQEIERVMKLTLDRLGARQLTARQMTATTFDRILLIATTFDRAKNDRDDVSSQNLSFSSNKICFFFQ